MGGCETPASPLFAQFLFPSIAPGIPCFFLTLILNTWPLQSLASPCVQQETESLSPERYARRNSD